jgi:hypothetical protein
MATRPPRQPADDDSDQPEWWQRSAQFRRWPIVLALILAFILFRAFQNGHAPSIVKSCTTPNFVLSTYKTGQHHEIDYSVTGPPGMKYLLFVGVSGFVSTNNELVPTPDAGLSKEQIQAASQRQTMDGDCLQSGRFGVLVPAGSYAVRLFQVVATGDVEPVASRQLVVTK